MPPTATTSARAVPHNLEAEGALLGSILLDNSALKLVVGRLSVDDFFSARHRLVFAKMLELSERSRAIDLVTLSEALSKNGTLENAGGAAYLSALTDGVPLGTQAAVAEYIRIVKDKSILRRIINSANNVIARALDGAEDGSSLLDLASEQFADIKQQKITVEAPEEKPKPTPLPQRYPLIPEAAWHPAAAIYRDAVSKSTEASDNWHFASFYTSVGTLLGRSVMTRMGKFLYPNLYIVLVGLVGGDGKDTAIDYAVNELIPRTMQLVYTPRAIDSRQGFVKGWDAWLKKPRDATDVRANLNGVNRAVLRMAEFRDVIDKINYAGTQSIASLINECYDGPPDLPRQTAQDDFSIDHPHLSAVFGTAIEYMRNLDEKDITSGVGRRLLIIPGDPKGPIPEPDPPDVERLNVLADLLRQVLIFWNEVDCHCIQLSSQARKLWCKWYVDYKKRVFEGDIIGAMTIGDRSNLRKIALINSALDRERETSEENLQRALAFGEYLFESRWPVFSEHGSNPNVRIENQIVEKVKQKGGRMPKRGLQKCFPRIDSEMFNRRLDFLCKDDGRLEKRKEGRMWWIISRDD